MVVKNFKIAITYTLVAVLSATIANSEFNYADALYKSILFYEGQRSGKLPPTQRVTWRKDSALNDGRDKGVDLSGGYYDAGDNIKFNFPMAYTTTMLAWSVHQYGHYMGGNLPDALDAIRWATDYFLKCTATAGVVYVQVGNPQADHNCWERADDMDTPRTTYIVNTTSRGSEVAAEMAAAMAAAGMVFRTAGDRDYARLLLQRAVQVFGFADKYRGSYKDSIGDGACPFYCTDNGYLDELVWAAAWLHKATKKQFYWDYILKSLELNPSIEYNWGLFGWDAKNAGLNVILSKFVMDKQLQNSTFFIQYADWFVCSVMPQSPQRTHYITPGGVVESLGVASPFSFLLTTYAAYMKKSQHLVRCRNVVFNASSLIRFSNTQIDYILGKNPMGISYMVGYGHKFPHRVHHRGASIPSLDEHPQHVGCKEGTPYFLTNDSNPNELTGAVVGGPDQDDMFVDNRTDAGKLEPTTYTVAPLVGLLAFFKNLHRQ